MSRAPNGLPEPHRMKSGRWRLAIQVGVGSREHRNRVFLSGSSALIVRRKRDDWLRAHAEGRRPPDKRLTVGTFLTRWLGGLAVRESTIASYHLTITRHVIPYIGTIALADLGALDIDEMLDAQHRRGVPAPTRSYALRVLSVALNVAVRKKRLILFNPVYGANEVVVQRRSPKVLNAEQVRALLEAARESRLGPLISLLASTGIRRGEALALTWPDWDRHAGTLNIDKTLLYVPRRGFGPGEPKTRKSIRTLSLPIVAQNALREQRRRQAEEQIAAGTRWFDLKLVFTGAKKRGGPVSGATVVRGLHRLCDEAGVPRIRPHDLRHFYASQLAEAGLSDSTRMAVMGHASREMTDRYTHATPTSGAAAEAIDSVLGSSVDATVDAMDW